MYIRFLESVGEMGEGEAEERVGFRSLHDKVCLFRINAVRPHAFFTELPAETRGRVYLPRSGDVIVYVGNKV